MPYDAGWQWQHGPIERTDDTHARRSINGGAEPHGEQPSGLYVHDAFPTESRYKSFHM